MWNVIGIIIFVIVLLFANIWEWIEVFEHGFFNIYLIGVILPFAIQCVVVVNRMIERSCNKAEDIIDGIFSDFMVCWGIFGLLQLVFFSGLDKFMDAATISFLSQPLKYSICCLIAQILKSQMELQMGGQLLKLREFYQRKIDVLQLVKRKMQVIESQERTMENLSQLFYVLQYPRIRESYQNAVLIKDSGLISELQKIISDAGIEIDCTGLTVPQVATAVQEQLLLAQSMRYHYGDENFRLSDWKIIWNDYNSIIGHRL